jgi:CHAT domain-containing protein/tetratricopeptide (TPR) repeat protein
MKVRVLVLLMLNSSFLLAQTKDEKLVDSLISNNLYSEASEIIQRKITTNASEAIRWTNKQAELLMAQGKLDEAESQLIKINTSNEFDKALTSNNLGWLYLHKGRSDKALELLQSAREGFTRSGNSKSKEAARCLSNLAFLYWSIGKMNQAEENGTLALQLRQNIFGNESEEVAASLNDLGLVYSSTNPDRALENYEKALGVYEKLHGKDHPKIAIAKTNIGLTYQKLELYGDAVNNFEDALSIWRTNYPGGHPNEALTLANLGSTYKLMKKPDAALQYYEKALAIFRKNYGNKHPDLAAIYNQIGIIKMDEAKYVDALNNFQEALCANVPEFNSKDIHQNPGINSYYRGMLLLYSLSNKARAWEGLHYGKTLKLQNLKLAISILYLCDSLVDNIRHQSSDVNDKIQLSASANDVYEDGVRIAQSISEMTMNSRRYREMAFYFAEKSKSATLQESIADAQAKSFAGIPSTLLEDEKNKKAIITQYTEKLTQKPTAEEEKKLREQLYQANIEYNQFIQKLEKDYPNYYNLKYSSSTVTVSDLQKLIRPTQAVLSFFIDSKNKRLYQFVITKSKLAIETHSIPDDFDRSLKGFTNSLLFNNFEIYQKSSGALAKLLLPRIPSFVKEVVVIPTGKLGAIPFESLPLKKNKATQFKDINYLLNRYAVSYEFSAGLFLQKGKSKTQTGQSIFLCAPVQFPSNENLNSLPGTEQEVNAIASLFSSPKVLKFADANEGVVKSKELSNYDYLHFATHGVVDAAEPALSRIFLNGQGSEDGNLYSGEIYNLNMNANLVVLSACETGLGKISSGEGVIGLSRALTYAGAKNLIVSFWPVVDESTSELMVGFYKLLKKNNSIQFSESLRQAKLEMIRGEKFSSPYYWAPFVLIGQ